MNDKPRLQVVARDLESSGRPLLEVDGLRIDLASRGVRRRLLSEVSLAVMAGESVGLVGESGSGKSMTIKAAMRLLPRTMAAGGQIRFAGKSVLDFSRRDLAQYRLHDVAVIHQDPRSHINPLSTIGTFLTEAAVSRRVMNRDEAHERARVLLTDMGIPDANRRLDQYPHQLSGGLLQRVMIAAALITRPKLIFADEPTTALDVTVQSEVMAILIEQIKDHGTGMLFVTHDLDLAAAVTDTLVVMYAGTVIERGSSTTLYSSPRHPYTAALLAARPSTTEVKRLLAIPGRPAAAYEVEEGCVFAARCAFATDHCRAVAPTLREVHGRSVACHRSEEIAAHLQASEVTA